MRHFLETSSLYIRNDKVLCGFICEIKQCIKSYKKHPIVQPFLDRMKLYSNVCFKIIQITILIQKMETYTHNIMRNQDTKSNHARIWQHYYREDAN